MVLKGQQSASSSQVISIQPELELEQGQQRLNFDVEIDDE
jgi:hypothetical protein